MNLPPTTWREIQRASVYLPQGRFIGIGVLENILRKSRRTNDQNALLWALYDDALRVGGEMLGGWTREDIHEYMLGEWFGWDVHDALGMKRKKPKRRSSRLTKGEFGDFVDFVVRRFAEHGIVLKLPGDAVNGA
jgi:hypothetical protein